MQRRDLLKALMAAPLLQLAAAEGAPLFFTKEEFAALDELTELIIPSDEHSPGAHAAGAAAFIDRSVAEAFLSEEKEMWRKGIAPYVPLDTKQRRNMLTEASEKDEKFFALLKSSTAFAYYTSKIGIHNDIQYVGNVVQEQFSGYEVT